MQCNSIETIPLLNNNNDILIIRFNTIRYTRRRSREQNNSITAK